MSDLKTPRIAQHKVKIASKNQKRSGSNNASTDVSPVVLDDDAFNVPDRLTGRLGAAELCRLFPWREWRFVCINVPYAEAVEFRPLIISLMTPLYTAMDLSIAMAFWFASRGIGVLDNMDGTSTVYKVDRVYFSVAWGQMNSWADIVDIDLNSTSRHGQGYSLNFSWTYPVYRHEILAATIGLFHPMARRLIRVEQKVWVDKLILRLVAASLGLDRAAVEPKRAVQFGARTAKMEDGKQKGHDVLLE
ncbi:hypothetical protein BASA60_011285 [Batrachochytrium salamandrivorans]|nr:hypothetical protein BASA60_011285 [Batrachochytrium salamandrivorans]